MKRALTIFAGICFLSLNLVAAHAATPTCFGKAVTELGTSGDDVIVGTSGVDVISGLGGNDTLFGGGGDDFICGGTGNDKIFGDRMSATSYAAPADDTLSGGRGYDRLFGDGNGLQHTGDTFIGGKGNDYINAGPTSLNEGYERENLVAYNGAPGPVSVFDAASSTGASITTVTGDGTDTLIDVGAIQGSRFDDSISINGWVDEVAGGGGNDNITYGADGAGGLEVYGDGNLCRRCVGSAGLDGGDTILFSPGSYGVDVSVYAGGGNDTVSGTAYPSHGEFGGSGDDSLSDTQLAYGEDGNDTLIGTTGYDDLYGGFGADTIRGRIGNDSLFGEEGNDTLNSKDLIAGNDTADGGTGVNVCTFDTGDTVLNCP
jgi:Ca2+-binding RTX toxin-like protein